ncbi:hypothetical protein MJO28_002861 [Puccinia striiformis f. sp. tritici]|uniref:Uncharacterized protein n=1 Tax=Puccinia striiformis f. sp. tritici TaxID=168172 RepID=A0ACC0ET84_9BASI|nr:hypothetical protein MJO28_002861 [Puccinia striiformis f. sp. tritici]
MEVIDGKTRGNAGNIDLCSDLHWILRTSFFAQFCASPPVLASQGKFVLLHMNDRSNKIITTSVPPKALEKYIPPIPSADVHSNLLLSIAFFSNFLLSLFT